MKLLKKFRSAFVVVLFSLLGHFSCSDEGPISSDLEKEIGIYSFNSELPLTLSKDRKQNWQLNEKDAQAFFKQTFPELSARVGSFENFEIGIDPLTGSVVSVSAMGYDELGKNVPIGFNIEPIDPETGLPNYTKSAFVEKGNKTETASMNTFALAETHSCTGNPCSCCQFIYRNGEIIGCNCYTGGHLCEQTGEDPKCDHRIDSVLQ
jgi:hypothetical protein